MTARTVPTMPDWVPGQQITSTLLNQITTYNRFWANPPMFRMYQTVAQSIPNATSPFTVLTMDTPDYDTDSGRAAGTPWSYTIPPGMTGRWQFKWRAGFAVNATGARLMNLFRNATGITAEQGSQQAVSAAVRTTDMFGDIVTIPVNAGDVMNVGVFQDSGGALNTDVNCSFEGRFVSLGNP